MKENYYVGIDIAKRRIRYQLENGSSQILAKGWVRPTLEDLERFCGRLEEQGARPQQTVIMLEATGSLHLPWCEHLSQRGYRVLAVNPLVTKRLYTPENAIRDHKTDAVDAAGICEVARSKGHRLSRFLYQSEAPRCQLQKLHGVRKQLRKALTNMNKCAAEILDLIFPELRRAGLTLTHLGLRKLLHKACTPQQIGALSLTQLQAYLGTKAVVIKESAQASFAPRQLAQASAPALRQMLAAMQALQQRLDQVDTQIAKVLPKAVCAQRYALARSLPAFGENTTAKLLAFLPADVTHWGSKKKITAKLQGLFGTDPRLRRSGTWKGKEKISKRGIEIGRTALFQIAFSSLTCDPHCRAVYDRLRQRGKTHKEAIVDLMRKHLRRLVSVLVEQKPFVPIPHPETNNHSHYA